MTLPVVDKAPLYYERFDRELRRQLKPLIDDQLLAEHRSNPLGPHGDRLRRVLNYFRRAPQAGKYVVVAVERWREYRLGKLSGVRGEAPQVLDEPVFRSEEEALHGAFLARVRDLLES
jgi:branched-chain amino acid transport system permease protein